MEDTHSDSNWSINQKPVREADGAPGGGSGRDASRSLGVGSCVSCTPVARAGFLSYFLNSGQSMTEELPSGALWGRGGICTCCQSDRQTDRQLWGGPKTTDHKMLRGSRTCLVLKAGRTGTTARCGAHPRIPPQPARETPAPAAGSFLILTGRSCA